MRSTAGILLLVIPLMAGCLNGQDLPQPSDLQLPLRPPKLLCLDEAGTPLCNFKATVTPDTRQANEVSIAVNPLDPLNIMTTGKDYTPDYAGECVWDGLYTTKDGGKTWKNQNLPGSPWKRLLDSSEPLTPFSTFWCATDPVVAFGPDGIAYWTVMPYQCDRLSGSKLGRGTVERGGFNDWLFTCSAMYVLVSTDGGLTWPTDKIRRLAVGPSLEHDQQWIAVAPNGMVMVCWTRYPYTDVQSYLPVRQNLPVAQPEETVYPKTATLCSYSYDKGESWTQPSELTAVEANGNTPTMDFDRNNSVYLAYADGKSVWAIGGKMNLDRPSMDRTASRDLMQWGTPAKLADYERPPRGGEYNWPVLRGSAFRLDTLPQVAVDRSDGPHAGTVYVTWFDHSGGEGNVLLSHSRDAGKTWSPPRRAHDDDPAGKADQFFPTISVGPDGTVDLAWYDRRDDPKNHLFDLYYTYSKDGGETLAPNLRVTDVSSDEQYSRHQNGMVFLGDYRDQDSTRQGAHLVWVDTRHHKADVFVATVLR